MNIPVRQMNHVKKLGLITAILIILCLPMWTAARADTTVPQGHWSYHALDQLAAFGLVQILPGQSPPYSRREIARLTLKAQYQVESTGFQPPPYAMTSLERLMAEYHPEIEELSQPEPSSPTPNHPSSDLPTQHPVVSTGIVSLPESAPLAPVVTHHANNTNPITEDTEHTAAVVPAASMAAPMAAPAAETAPPVPAIPSTPPQPDYYPTDEVVLQAGATADDTCPAPPVENLEPVPFIPEDMFSSSNVTLGHWTYKALDKVSGYGLTPSDLKGTRPYTRAEVARLIVEASLNKERTGIELPDYIEHLLVKLCREYQEEVAILSGEAKAQGLMIKPLEDIEMRYVFSDGPRRRHDGFANANQGMKGHEGTPLVQNNDGVVYGQNHNVTAQASGRARWSKYLAAYVEPILKFRENKNNYDDIDTAEVDLLRGYGKFTIWNTEFEIGRDSFWWGQGRHGTLLLSNNAAPFDTIKLSNPTPFVAPWLLRYLGPTKLSFFITQLESDRRISNPTMMGLRVNIKPHPNVELGATGTIIGQGEGRPKWKFDDFLDMLSFGAASSGTGAGDKLFSLDARIRLPFLWNAELYAEYGGEDTTPHFWNTGEWSFNEILFGDVAYVAGLYIPSITSDGRTDLRVEYAQTARYYTDNNLAFWYSHSVYRSGYTYNGLIMGHHVGGDAHDVFTRVTHAATNDIVVGLDFDYMTRGSENLSPVREKVYQVGGDITFDYDENITIWSRYGFGYVENYDMNRNDNRYNHLFMASIRYHF